jgi:hypothetical protein
VTVFEMHSWVPATETGEIGSKLWGAPTFVPHIFLCGEDEEAPG